MINGNSFISFWKQQRLTHTNGMNHADQYTTRLSIPRKRRVWPKRAIQDEEIADCNSNVQRSDTYTLLVKSRQSKVFLWLREHVHAPGADNAVGRGGEDIMRIRGANDADVVNRVGMAKGSQTGAFSGLEHQFGPSCEYPRGKSDRSNSPRLWDLDERAKSGRRERLFWR